MNMRRGRLGSRYGAIEACGRAAMAAGAASLSSRRRGAGSVSGQNASRWLRPSAVRHCRQASGPRQRTVNADTGTPSTLDAASPGAITTSQAARRDSLHASRKPWADAASASGQAAGRGISDAITDNAAASASSSRQATSSREGRHSRRQGADALDEHIECGIGHGLLSKEPSPQPIVLAIQQL